MHIFCSELNWHGNNNSIRSFELEYSEVALGLPEQNKQIPSLIKNTLCLPLSSLKTHCFTRTGVGKNNFLTHHLL